jgi:hypothetical protein
MKIMKSFQIILLLLITSVSYSQEVTTPVLEREISLTRVNQPLEHVLNEISQQGNFVFSYSPDAINHQRAVSLNIKNKSIRFTLNSLFKEENIEYKVRGKYIILKKKGESKKEDSRIFEGYVYDSRTGEKLTEASVYDKTLLASAITDKYGYFSMEVPSGTSIKSLQISKLGYSDTTLVSLDSALRHRNIEVALQQENATPKSWIDFQKYKPGWIVPEKLKINARNITQPVFRTIQLSLIPSLSTNRFLGGAAVNEISINATVGYVQEIRKFEAGGLLNFVRSDVRYFQAAGLGNIVGGNITGFQGAGLFNIVQDVKGFQAAGIFNDAGIVGGTQAAGIYNIADGPATVQLAGIFNIATKNLVQVAGIFNRSTESHVQTAGLMNLSDMVSFQAAGLINRTDTLTGSQVAGLINTTNSGSIAQVAGLANITRDDALVQIAGLFNKARNIKSLQLAAFNFADTASGLPLGIFSFIRKGYHKLEFSADETFPVNISFRTGTKKFHTFLTAGASSFNKNNFLWNVGYGLGTSFGNPIKMLFDIDFSSSEVVYRNNFNGTYHWYKLYFGIDRKVTPKLGIIAGISFNALLSDSFQPDYKNIDSKMPFYAITETNFSNGHNLKTWVGGKIGIRLF